MGTSTKRITEKDPAKKLAHRRLTVLELAERLGNVSEACRRGGMDRTSFYEWKRRFQPQGLDGLKDLPPIHKSHPLTTPPEVVERIAGAEPGAPRLWRLRRGSAPWLKLAGCLGRSPTIQKILQDDMGSNATSAGWR